METVSAENRKIIQTLRDRPGRIARLRGFLADNGVRWTLYYVVLASLMRSTRRVTARMARLERKYFLPGRFGPRILQQDWLDYDWKQLGEEWTPTPEWKAYIVNDVLLRYCPRGKTVLEIGPGGGRWSEVLQKTANRLVMVDVAEKSIELCRRRFSDCNNVEFFINRGDNLDFLPEQSIDFVWCFDVFVCIGLGETAGYVKGFERVLKAGGRGIVNVNRNPHTNGRWLSYGCDESVFFELLEKHGMRVITVLDPPDDIKASESFNNYSTIVLFEK